MGLISCDSMVRFYTGGAEGNRELAGPPAPPGRYHGSGGQSAELHSARTPNLATRTEARTERWQVKDGSGPFFTGHLSANHGCGKLKPACARFYRDEAKQECAGRRRGCSTGFPDWCFAGFPTRKRLRSYDRSESPRPCRLGSRRYSTFGNLRHGERWSHVGIRAQLDPELDPLLCQRRPQTGHAHALLGATAGQAGLHNAVLRRAQRWHRHCS